VPVRDRRPEDEQPPIRSVQEQQLVRSVGGEQDEAAQPVDGQEEGQEEGQAGQARQGEKGPISAAMDRAQENNWVYGSVAEKARKTGLLDRADEVFSKVKSTLAGR
jgi:hypothetical protein